MQYYWPQWKVSLFSHLLYSGQLRHDQSLQLTMLGIREATDPAFAHELRNILTELLTDENKGYVSWGKLHIDPSALLVVYGPDPSKHELFRLFPKLSGGEGIAFRQFVESKALWFSFAPVWDYMTLTIQEIDDARCKAILKPYLTAFLEQRLTTNDDTQPQSPDKHRDLFFEEYERSFKEYGSRQRITLSKVWRRKNENRMAARFWETVLSLAMRSEIQIFDLGIIHSTCEACVDCERLPAAHRHSFECIEQTAGGFKIDGGHARNITPESQVGRLLSLLLQNRGNLTPDATLLSVTETTDVRDLGFVLRDLKKCLKPYHLALDIQRVRKKGYILHKVDTIREEATW